MLQPTTALVAQLPSSGPLRVQPLRPIGPVLSEAAARPDAANREWELYDQDTATAAIVDAVNGAQHVVNAEFFGISDAGKGAALTSALTAAAARGVEVNVIADQASMFALPVGSFHRMRRKVRAAGGTVVVTTLNPLAPRHRATPALRHVDHRKVVTVDGRVGFTGGMNFVSQTDGYHDSMVRLTGLAAARLGAEQLDRWSRVGGKVTDRHRASVERNLAGRPVRPTDHTEIGIIANAPEQRRFELSDAYVELIRGAKRRLWISSVGISDRVVMAEIRAAAERGVDVRVVAPGTAPMGVPVISWVARGHMEQLTASGGAGYEIPEVLHRKAIVADDQAILSSYNLTGRSRAHDHEVGVRTSDPEFVKAVADVLERDMSRGRRLAAGDFDGFGGWVGGLLAGRLTY